MASPFRLFARIQVANSMANGVVYALVDPREPHHRRYIGQAINPKMRFAQHLRDGFMINRRSTRKAFWIKKLLDEGIAPAMIILEDKIPIVATTEREQLWISDSVSEGHCLLNAAHCGSKR